MELKIPQFRKLLHWDGNPVKGENYMEQRLHLFALMMALYPFTPTQELAEEFQMDAHSIMIIANQYGVHKTREYQRQKCKANGRDVFLRLYWSKQRKMKFYHHKDDNQLK